MITDDLKTIIEELNTQGKNQFLDAADIRQVAEFEEKAGFRLPSRYKEWLLISDGGECFLPAGIQFYGVAHKPIINTTDDDRPNDDYIVIGALASGDPILFEKNSEKISIYNHEAGRIESDETYEDFIAFLRDLPGILGIGG